MIEQVLEVIRTEVNDFIGNKLEDNTIPNRVILTSFVDDNGQVAIPSDSVGLSLLNIEEEKTFKEAGMVRTAKAESSSLFVNPPVSLNLQIMFTAYFNNYAESLKHLSFILACFQTKRVFNQVDYKNDTANTGSHCKQALSKFSKILFSQKRRLSR